ncbi:hypothetical protein [Saccharopolyspora gloriosae]|uniref:MmyB family transcriptional regulator n=1 Tax=Saccharopolyspora gloriosae TaxID=455344 RepID=UPI001FB5D67C|nr:hypothetical protein [Saccharopolyspora gloriosae]
MPVPPSGSRWPSTSRTPAATTLWADHDVAFRRNDRKRIVQPTLGLLEVNCLNLFSEDGLQRLLRPCPGSLSQPR